MRKLLMLMTVLFMSIVIVGCKEKTGEITWSGLEDETVVRGDQVDLLEGVKAVDSIDGDISDQITIKDEGGFDTSLTQGYEVTYSVTNSSGVTETATKTFIVVLGHNVANGRFDIPNFAWTLDNPGGASSISYENEQATITIENAGTAWWSIQLNQQNILFEEGKTYKLTVNAKSPDGRSIAAGFEDVEAGYAMLSPGFQSMQLTDEMQEYSIYYTANQDHGNIKVVVYLGYQLPTDAIAAGETQTVVIDNVNVEVVEPTQDVVFDGIEDVTAYSGNVNFDPLSGVTATDGEGNDVTDQIEVLGTVPNEVKVASTYFVTYLVTLDDGSFSYATRSVRIELAKEHAYQTVNGDFAQGFTGWTQDVIQTQGSGEAAFIENGDGTVSIRVDNVSDAGWHIQLQQASSDFKAGETYVVRLVIKSDMARKVTVEVVDPGAGFAEVAPALHAIPVGPEWTTYEIEFTADKDYNGIKVGLLLGNVDGLQPNGATITVDELQVYKYDAFNEELTTTVEPWVLDNISGEIVEGELVVEFAEGELGAAPWNNQLYQTSGSQLVAGHTYKVEVNLKSSIDRDMRVWIEDAAKGFAAIANDDHPGAKVSLVADEYQVITYEITITEDLATNNAKFVVMFGDDIVQGQAHTVTIDYFRITDITNTTEK